MSNNSERQFIGQVASFIATHQLMSTGKKYLVAISGGADSVALLRTMVALGYDVEAAHCNFNLRGDESNRDEQFCKNLCLVLKIPLHIAHFDTKTYADTHHLSIEMAARSLRYTYFRQLMHDIGAEAVVVAHHKDDAVETMLINLIRGTGIRGLTGIAPKRDGVIRPLLCVNREQILSYLGLLRQDFVTDSSNLVDDVVRNKIRLNILPLMREINPSVSETMAATADRLTFVADIYDDTMQRMADEARVSTARNDMMAFDLQRINSEGLLFHILQPMGFSPKTVEEAFGAIVHRHTGAFFSSASHEMVVDRQWMVVMPRKEPFKSMRIPITGRYAVGEAMLRVSEVVIADDFHFSRQPSCASLDAEKVTFPLELRTVREGDRFDPLGMKGKKLVSDFLTDQKVHLLDKRRQIVVADAKDNILWVVGRRQAHHCRITEKTQKAIILEWIE